jgi:peroxin-3
LPYLLPAAEQEDFVLQESGVLSSSQPSPQIASSLRHLLDETSDLIDSPPFTHILTLLNNEAFSTLIDEKCAAEAFKASLSQPAARKPDQTPPQSFSSAATIIPIPGPSVPKAKLATILAVISRQAHIIGNGPEPPNEYLVAMEHRVRELEAFAAVVYSNNFDFEVPTSLPDCAEPVADPSPMDLTSPSPHPSLDVPATKSTETLTPPGGDSSIIELAASSSSISTSGKVSQAAITGSNDRAKIPSDPDFEKIWGKAIDGHGLS